MEFFRISELTQSAQNKLLAYDYEVRALLPAEYKWPIRMRDWELLKIIEIIERMGHIGDVIDTGSFNTFLPVWLSARADRVIASDMLFLRWRKNWMRRLGFLEKKSSEAPYRLWSQSTRCAAHNITIQNVDLTCMPFPDARFDCITSISVIEHIPNVECALAEMYRCLKPGGVALITTDCADMPHSYQEGTRYFSYGELVDLFSPYVKINPDQARPDFSKENWVYGKNIPLLTAFVLIQKPLDVS
jgi:SAM-dependent methyltransferase